MPLLLAATLAAVSAVQPSCSWDHPGVNPYRGNVRDALERYTDIPPATRIALKHRIEQGQPDEQVEITRDAIRGKRNYYPGISDMHFGADSVCHGVTRGKWDAARVEPGAVYCVKEHCILVPKICGNVSRISLRGPHPVAVLESRPNSPYRPRKRLGDAMPGMELGLADADPVEPDEDDPATERNRLHNTLNKLALAGTGLAGDDSGGRNRLPGHYPPAYQDPLEPVFDDELPSPSPSPVPEADTWTMLLAGLALVAAVVRRRS